MGPFLLAYHCNVTSKYSQMFSLSISLKHILKPLSIHTTKVVSNIALR